MPRRKNHTHPAGFTLVEMLTVIAIIAILVGLLFPAVQTALRRAENSKAQTAVAGLTTAFKAYYTEYGRWPVSCTTNYCGVVDSNMVSVLRGINNNTAPYTGNTRLIQFFEIGPKDTNSVGAFADPWGKAYQFILDTTYNNQIAAPDGKIIYGGVVVWSNGRDGTFGTTDDVKSW